MPTKFLIFNEDKTEFFNTVNEDFYVDRILISVAKTDVASTSSLSDKQMGWALSIFSLGYALFQMPSG